MTRARGMLLRSLVLTLAGCAVGPRFEKPKAPLPAGWSENTDPRLRTQRTLDLEWWKKFGDPTLDRLVKLAYQQNLSLQVAGLRIFEARARLGIAIGEQFPQVQAAVASATAVGLSKHQPNSLILDRRFGDYQVGFDAAWELDIWRKYGSAVRAEQATFLATVADYDDVLVSLTAEVARTYVTMRTFEVLVEQARQNAAVQEEGLKIARARFGAGATSELDVAQAAALFESTRTTIPQFQIRVQQARNALCTLIGRPVDCAATLLDGAKEIPAAPAQVGLTVPAELLRRRPDIRSAELNAMAQCDRIGVAKADYYPRFTLFGSVGTQTSTGAASTSSGASLGDLFGAGSLFYSIGPRIFWPLFNYGRITNNVRVQDARLQQLLVTYQSTVLAAAQEVEDALTGFLRSQEAVLSAQSAAIAAEQAVKLALVQYREGAVDYTRVLDSQRAMLQEQNSLAQARSAVVTNLVALYKALGGGWELRDGQPFVSDQNMGEMRGRTNWGFFLPKGPAPPSQR